MKQRVRLEDLPDALRPAEAALVLRIGRNAVYEACARGEIPSFRIGRSLRISRVALQRLLGSADTERGDEPR